MRGTALAFALALAPALLAAPARALDTTLSAPGASDALTERLTAASAVMAAQARGRDTPQDLLAAALADYRTLIQVLYDAGHFSPVISIRLNGREASEIRPAALPARIDRVEIAVQPGPQFRFGRAEIGPLAPHTELPESYRKGQIATTGAIRDAAIAGIDGWRQAGHAKADIGAQKITAIHPRAELAAEIRLAPGPRLRFGRMTITGDTDVRPESIHAIAGFPTGEIYDPDQLQKVGTRLRRTGSFSTVALREADTPNPDGTLDVEARFEDMPKRHLAFGAELSSREGLDLTMTWMHRNLFRRANRLRFEASIRNIGGDEDIDGRLGLRLDRPDVLGPDDSMFYMAELERLNRTHFESWRALAGIGVRRSFSDKLYGELAATLRHSRADDAFGSDRRFTYFALPGQVQWDRRDNPVDARDGFYVNAELMPFLGLAGTKSGARLYLDGRAYQGFAGDRFVLAGRLQIGSLMGAAQDAVSPDLLFFSGGAGSVRGQPYESLGVPVPPAGAIAGGRSFLGASLELRGRVSERIWLVGFYDYGAVDADPFVDRHSASHSGAGLGLRYDLGGFGPIRFDLAYPVSGSTGDGLQFYLGIGQAF